jgi:hypothetical protein
MTEINWTEIDKDLKKKFDEISIKTMLNEGSHSSDVISKLVSIYLEVMKEKIIELDKKSFSDDKQDIVNSLILNVSKIDKSVKETLTILKTFPNFEIDKVDLVLILDAFTESIKQKYARNL